MCAHANKLCIHNIYIWWRDRVSGKGRLWLRRRRRQRLRLRRASQLTYEHPARPHTINNLQNRACCVAVVKERLTMFITYVNQRAQSAPKTSCVLMTCLWICTVPCCLWLYRLPLCVRIPSATCNKSSLGKLKPNSNSESVELRQL